MSEAPKKIWFDIEECSAGPVQFADDEIPYIREDVVLELVEALKKLIATGCDQYTHHQIMSDPSHFINAALAKLEESHE